ncbi:MAG: DUF547 domain-containing protein [Nitrospinae bacterium]|nr:DUF547 domain-containing protein [Nitrospinota bacterium]
MASILLISPYEPAMGEEVPLKKKEHFEYAVDLLNAARGENQEEIKEALGRLEKVTPPLPGNTQEATAFWVNLYNGIVTWRKLLDPNGLQTESSRKYFFTQPVVKLAVGEWSLDDIEHGVLRGNANRGGLNMSQILADSPKLGFVFKKADPRIHGALNCGAVSCPPISYYDPKGLEKQLDTAISNIILQSEFHPETNELNVSRIFEWYNEDFKSPSLLEWFDRFYDNKAYRKARESGKKIKISFMEYKWK